MLSCLLLLPLLRLLEGLAECIHHGGARRGLAWLLLCLLLCRLLRLLLLR